jgi:predicted site-specific integrase-resolvase
LRALAGELGVAYPTLQRRFQRGKIRWHTSTLKPVFKPENKIARLKLFTSMIDQTSTAVSEPSLLSRENILHIVEK